MAGKVVDFVINTVFKNRGVQQAKQAIAGLWNSVKGSLKSINGAAQASMDALKGSLGAPWDMATRAIREWAKVVKAILDDAALRAKETALAVADNWKASAESMKQSFARVFRFIADGWDNLNRSHKNDATVRNAEYENDAASLSLEHEREINRMARSGASDKEISNRREELRYEERLAEMERKRAENEQKLLDIEERRKQRSKDKEIIEKEVLPDAYGLIRNSMPGERQKELAGTLAASFWSFTTKRTRDNAKEILNGEMAALDARRKVGEEAVRKASETLKKNAAAEEDDAAEEEKLKIQQETLQAQEEQLRIAEQTRKIRNGQKDAERANAEALKKAEQEEKAAREKEKQDARDARQAAIDAKRDEIDGAREAAAEEQNAHRAKLKAIREEEAETARLLQTAKDAAQAQIPTDADVRARRRFERRGGYGGGGIGRDGIAGNWDDPKAIARYERIQKKLDNPAWHGRLSKSDVEFKKNWEAQKKAFEDAKKLARQQEALRKQREAEEKAAWKAQVDSAKTLKDLEADLKALLRAK